MVHMAATDSFDSAFAPLPFTDRTGEGERAVLIIQDEDSGDSLLSTICTFLGLRSERVRGDEDLACLLHGGCPLAIIAPLDGQYQDGCHVMKVAASINRALPILLLTDGSDADLGAVDAVSGIWGLTHVRTISGSRDIGVFVDFLCQAAQEAGMSRLLRV